MEKITPKLLSWASILEEKTRHQAIMTSEMEFIQPHMALMPDAHLGKGATVGSVIPTIGAIMPAAVGVDIGCGMIAVRTQFTAYDMRGKDLSVLRHSIERSIPLSAGGQNRDYSPTSKLRIAKLEQWRRDIDADALEWLDDLAPRWRLQLGTLGSGNHFIEVSLDEDNNVWLFLHSGSRGVGNKIAQFHIKRAQAHCKANFIHLPDPDLAYLIDGTTEFNEYIEDLNWAQAFALANREEMMDRVIHDMNHFMRATVIQKERINCHHNFTKKERHFGRDVWLSRKGAILASEGTPGLIPGSMGTASYVVEGKGNRAAMNSSPHGAGRNFSRKAARDQFTIEDLRRSMVGIEYHESAAFLDEIPAAYKDIDIVMQDAADLVAIKHTLRQIINVKGD